MLHRSRELGLRPVFFEAGGDVGGTWYWNRYPGARCDVESMEYSLRVLRRAPAGVGVDRALRHPARDPPLPRPRRRPLRPPPRHPVRHPRRRRPPSTRPTEPWTVTHRPRRRADAPASSSWPPAASRRPTCPTRRAATPSPARRPHRPLAARGRRLHRAARRRHRHRLVGHPVHPAHRRGGGRALRLPAHAQLLGAGAQPAARPRASSAASRPTTPSSAPRTASMPIALRRAAADASSGRPSRSTEEERRAEYEERWADGGLPFLGAFTDLLFDHDGQRHRGRVRPRARSATIVRRPRGRRALTPDTVVGCKRLCVDTGYYETFNRPNVTSSTCGEPPIEEITPDGLRTSRRRATQLDAIVFATGFDAMTGALLRIDIPGRDGRTLRDAWAGRAAHLPRPRRRGLPEPVHHHRPRQPVGAHQHARVDRAARRVDRRLHRLPARARPHSASRPTADAAGRSGSTT